MRSTLVATFLAAIGLVSMAFAQARDPLPVPDVAPYRTLKCDFHMHTVFSDGEVWPTTRVAEAWRDGLDAIAITDHVSYNPHKQDIPVDLARPHAIARGAAGNAGIILIPAVEVAEGDLHANALFVKDPKAFTAPDLQTLLRTAREQDAFVFWNHPGWKETAKWFPKIAAAYDEKLIQGVELVNGLEFYKEAFPWIGEKSLAILADSDVHAPISPGYAPRQRPVTLVFAKTADADGVREALFSRRTAAWMGGELWGPEMLLAGLWNGGVRILGGEASITGSNRTVRLTLENTTAIPFRMRVAKTPEWLTMRGGELPGEKAIRLTATVSRDAPPGKHMAEVELELTNVHVEPGRNVAVKLPLTITVP